MKRIYKVLLSLAIVCVFVAIIFSFSEQNGSESHSVSQKVSYKIISTILNDKDAAKIKDGSLESVAAAIDFPVRKLAHITIYLGLGFLITTALWFIYDYDLHFMHVLIALLIVFLVGCCDETVQYFSGGRGATIKDAFIDAFGGALGIYFHFIVRDFVRHVRNGFRKIKR